MKVQENVIKSQLNVIEKYFEDLSQSIEIDSNARIDLLKKIMNFQDSLNDKECKSSFYNDTLKILETYSDFIVSPASSKYHGCYPSGLFDHSISVYKAALLSAPIYNMEYREINPIAIIFHDICKVGMYKQQDGKYTYNENYVGIEHGAESLRRLLSLGIEIPINWQLAIAYHMGAFDVSHTEMLNFSKYSNNPEVLILHQSDMIASKIYKR